MSERKQTGAETDELYEPLDDYLERLKKLIQRESNYLGLAGFDRLNVTQTRKMTQSMFDRIDRFNRAEYAKLVKHAWRFVCRKVKKKVPEFGFIDYVGEYLNGYDPVTGYIYTHELDRKRMRLNEAIMASREYGDRNAFEKAIRRTADLLYTQSMQYGTDLIQAAMIETYERAGIKRLRWVAVLDGRECNECHDMDGTVYKLKDYPPKPHYACRCYPMAVVEIP